MDNYNYPMGADTSDAPWNQPPEPDPVSVIANITVTLTNEIRVFTDDFFCDFDDNDKVEKVNLNSSYKDVEKLIANQHKSIPELLQELAKYINGELAGGDISRSRRQELESMLDDCKGWTYTIDVEEYELE